MSTGAGDPIPTSTSKQRQVVPKWVPISLLAVTTAALAVPAVLLWRQRSAALRDTLAHPPPRKIQRTRKPLITSSTRSGVENEQKTKSLSVDPPPRRIGRLATLPRRTMDSREVVLPKGSIPSTSSTISAATYDPFIGPLYSLGAFGIATLLVGISGVAGVVGVQSAMGIDNVEDFAKRMRELILNHMPLLSSRIHRPVADDDDSPLNVPGHNRSTQSTSTVFNAAISITGKTMNPTIDSERMQSWTWPEAERRLTGAFERGGFSEWAECAIHELEAEGKAERRRRGF